MKQAGAATEIPRHRILTNLPGELNRVIQEYEAEDIAKFQSRMQQFTKSDAFKEKMKDYTDLWLTGEREIWRAV